MHPIRRIQSAPALLPGTPTVPAGDHSGVDASDSPGTAGFGHVLPSRRTCSDAGHGERAAFAAPRLGDECCEVTESFDAESTIQRFRERLAEWRLPGDSLPEERSWNHRINDGIAIGGRMSAARNSVLHGVFLLGQPIGLMETAFDGGSRLYVANVATHPGSEGALWRLMERAIDRSVQCGFGGRLYLYSFNDRARAAYKAVGFVDAPGNPNSRRMEFRPDVEGGPWVRNAQGVWTRRVGHL